MVLNAAVQMLREADELKQKILKFKSGTSMLQEHSLWATQQQLQKVYQKVLVLDLDYALDKKVEQDLWNVGFKQQIEALQAVSKDRKNPLRSEAQAMLSWVLQAAAGFYLCLLHQICTTFKLDLPFRRRASLLGWVEGWGAAGGCGGCGGCARAAPHAARYICQHCLVHLGDLARYRHQLRVAHTFYRHALVVSAHSGQPYNQLALVSWRRGRRLGALYWHVRSLLVRAPFPPAPANLARTLQAAGSRDPKDLPVLPGIRTETPPAVLPAARLDAHAHVTELIRALHYIHTVQQLDVATQLVNTLNSSLTALVATDGFESMTLIKMAVVIIWAVQSSTDELADTGALTPEEAQAAGLAEALAAGALLAMLLPAYTLPAPPPRAMAPLKVWLQWTVCRRRCGDAWAARPQIWPALAHTLNALAEVASELTNKYETVPLSEDCELEGFLPLEEAFQGLQFASRAAWHHYGGRLPEQPPTTSPGDMTATCLSNEPELENKVRAYRIVELGKRISEMRPEHLTYVEEDGLVHFTAPAGGSEQLTAAIAELSSVSHMSAAGEDDEGDSEDEPPPPVVISEADFREKAAGEDDEGDSEDEPPPPVVISEADFKEKVREKRVGILKPQGSLERAREERAQAGNDDDADDVSEEGSKAEDKREARKARVNIAMAAIMRKQEESNKQVKFVTPPPTPESTDQPDLKEQDKPKVIQPKPIIKSLANLPIGRKTGGILSLKDKSGYPHLVNAEEKKEKEEKKERENVKQQSQGTQSYPKRQEQPWSANPTGQFNDPRMTFQKHYGIQNTQLNYTFQPQAANVNVNNQGIRLPVVNPKEIDVRTAALQKQNSRQEMFQEGHKFNHNYQISGDKKNFLNDLPPRFANQYRYWQTSQDNQFSDNKFRDDSFKANNTSLFNNQQRPGWMNPPENFQPQNNWWKPENPPSNFNTNYSIPPPTMNIQPNFYTPPLNTNPYQNLPSFNQMQNQSIGQNKDSILTSNYIQHPIGQHQIPTLPNLVSSQNFNSSLNSFGTYAPPVGYDSSMYPQFNNKLGYDPLQMKMMDKTGYQGNKDLLDMGGLGFGSNVMDLQQRNLRMNFNDPMSVDAKTSNQSGQAEISSRSGTEAAGNTYSLFSGSDPPGWAAPPQPPPHPSQSLWSGPGPSPLERLLEQQKQLKPPQ